MSRGALQGQWLRQEKDLGRLREEGLTSLAEAPDVSVYWGAGEDAWARMRLERKVALSM